MRRFLKSSDVDCDQFVFYYKLDKRTKKNKRIKGLLSKNKKHIHKWVSYNKFELKPVNIPDNYIKYSPKCFHSGKHSFNDYLCGSKIVLKKNDIPELNHYNYRKYFIHNNGGRPFLVYTDMNNVYIYKVDNKFNENYIIEDKYYWRLYSHLVKKYFNVTKVFIGKSKLNEITKRSGMYGREFNGNSILIHVTDNKYIYIGNQIFSFDLTNDSILKYHSPIGNSDVPYPIIIGKVNVYFMLDLVYINKKIILQKEPNIKWDTSYWFYQEYIDPNNSNNAIYKDDIKKIKNIKIIHE